MNDNMNNNYSDMQVNPNLQQPVAPQMQPEGIATYQQPMTMSNIPSTPAAPVTPTYPAENIQPVMNTMAAPAGPIVADEVAPTEIVQGIEEPKIEEEIVDTDQSGDGSNVTFDYNELYGVQSKDINTEAENVEQSKPLFEVQEVVLDEKRTGEKITSDITPEFNMQALDGSATNSSQNNTVLDESEADRADTRRKIFYIGVLTLLLIIVVKFIFPMLAGYNL